MYYSWVREADEIEIPMSELSLTDHTLLLSFVHNFSDSSINIQWNSAGDVNRWQVVAESAWMVIFRIVLSAQCIALVVVAVYKLARFIQTDGIQVTIHQFTLTMIAVGSFCTSSTILF